MAEKKPGRLGQIAAIIAASGSLVVALATAWTSVSPRQVERQEEKADAFYSLFAQVVAEQREVIDQLRDELAKKDADGNGVEARREEKRPSAAPRVRTARATSAAPPPPVPAPPDVADTLAAAVEAGKPVVKAAKQIAIPTSLDALVQRAAPAPPPDLEAGGQGERDAEEDR